MSRGFQHNPRHERGLTVHDDPLNVVEGQQQNSTDLIKNKLPELKAEPAVVGDRVHVFVNRAKHGDTIFACPLHVAVLRAI